MATVNVRSAYELLRRAIEQQSQQQQGIDVGSPPNAAPEYNSNGNDSPQGGVLGRRPAIQGEPKRQQPFDGSDGEIATESPNPDFRRLSRVSPSVQPEGAIDPSKRPNNQSSPSYPSAGDSASFDALSVSPQGAGSFGAYGDQPKPPWWAFPGSTMTTAGLGVRIGRLGVPIPLGPTSVPDIPMPTTPEWLKDLQRHARTLVGIDPQDPAPTPQVPTPTFQDWNKPLMQKKASRKGNDRDDDDDEDINAKVDRWNERNRRRVAAAARERDKQVDRYSDPGPPDYCYDRHKDEEKRCYRIRPDYPNRTSSLWACINRAQNRRDMCTANRGQPRPDEPKQWSEGDDEVFSNHYRP